MSEARRDLDLPQEPLGADRGCELAPEHLDRHLAVVLPVLREVHGRHAAATELAVNGVTVRERRGEGGVRFGHSRGNMAALRRKRERSEEHTSELQSRLHLVCRLLLEKKK